MKDQEVKEFLLKQMTEQWMKDNPQLLDDINNLAQEFVFFNAKWGTNLNPVDLLEHGATKPK